MCLEHNGDIVLFLWTEIIIYIYKTDKSMKKPDKSIKKPDKSMKTAM